MIWSYVHKLTTQAVVLRGLFLRIIMTNSVLFADKHQQYIYPVIIVVVSRIPVKIRVHPVYSVLFVINAHAIWPAQLVSVDFNHVTSVAMATTNKWKVMLILQPISKEYIPRHL